MKILDRLIKAGAYGAMNPHDVLRTNRMPQLAIDVAIFLVGMMVGYGLLSPA